MRGFVERVAVSAVWDWIDGGVGPLSTEAAGVGAGALGRVLGESVRAPRDVPHFDRAAMDGYAVRGAETFGADDSNPIGFRVVGRCLPGRASGLSVGVGEAVEIATGAPIPAGADAVVRAEGVRRRGVGSGTGSGSGGDGELEAASWIEVVEASPPGRHVGLAGEDVRRGTTVLEAGRVLRAQDLGLLAALGVSEARLVRRPRVAILATGREILPAGAAVPLDADDPRVPDSNSVMLAALAGADSAMVRVAGPVADDRGALREAISGLAEESDLLIVSGGSSAGPEDHAPSLVRELGTLAYHGLALRPASPAGVGRIGGALVLLAPGNPVSALCAYDLIGSRIVRRLAGLPGASRRRVVARPLAEKAVSQLGRLDYVRAGLAGDGLVRPMATGGAGILSGATRADGYFLIPPDSEGFPPGARVELYLYDDHPPTLEFDSDPQPEPGQGAAP